MKHFSATYGDYIKFNAKSNEDAILASKKSPIFSVADGVTQSRYLNGRYALPYGAKEAARIFCRTVTRYLEKNYSSFPRKAGIVNGYIERAFDLANKNIRELNIKHGINEKTLNYTTRDWFDAVGIAAAIVGNVIFYGYVGDCGLVVFGKNNKKKFQTRDMHRVGMKKFQEKYPNYKTFSSQKRAHLVHKEFRNKPDGNGYGSFSGEEGVGKYYHFGSKKLQDGDMAVLYSDGFFELLKDKKFVEIIRKRSRLVLNKFVIKKAKENPQKYGHDRTFASFTVLKTPLKQIRKL